MRILVTGAAGYIGSRFCQYFSKMASSPIDVVYAVDNLMYNQTSLIGLNQVKFRFADVRNVDSYKYELLNCDFFIPLAAIVGAPACNRNPESLHINFTAITYAIETLFENSRFPHIIYCCTNSGYGNTDGSLYCTEDTPINPISDYGKQKVEVEKYFKEVNYPNWTSLRLATVFGPSPRMRIDLLVNYLVYKAYVDKNIILYDKDAHRNYIHVDDVVKALWHVTNFPALVNREIYNVGNDALNMTKDELVKYICDCTPPFVDVFQSGGDDPDKRNYIVSSDKFYKTGFRCNKDLEDGIYELMDCYDIIKNLPNRFGNI